MSCLTRVIILFQDDKDDRKAYIVTSDDMDIDKDDDVSNNY